MRRRHLFLLLLFTACAPKPDSASGPPAEPPPSPTVEVQAMDPPSGPEAMAPRLAESARAPLLTWLEPDGADGHHFYLSRFEGASWSPRQLLGSANDVFANWADLPAVAEAADGRLTAHWLRKLGSGTYAYGVALLQEAPGAAWQEHGWLHDDTSATEHGFVSYAALAEDGLQAFWLDGRNMLDGGAMQLRTTRVDAGSLGPSELLDDRVCECCSTDAALTNQGPIVVYRDRSPEEIRDIAIVRATTAGWSPPNPVATDGWQIHGCPVNGPAVAASGSRVAVAWFSAPDDRARVQIAFSEDSGAGFTSPIPVDTEAPVGRVDVALAPTGEAFVSWMGRAGERAEIRWRRVSRHGEAGPVQRLAQTSPERAAGVPQMILHGEHLLFAWVEPSEPARLRTRRISWR